jgi:Ser/Thr protein kinase RdoA (MazF antagonist)
MYEFASRPPAPPHVQTRRSIGLIERFIAAWRGVPRSLRHLRDGANSVYEFQSPRQRLVVRVTDDRHRTWHQLEAELSFIGFVASRGIPVAHPVLSVRGAQVETLEDEDGAPYHGVVFPLLPGRHFRFFSSDIDRPLFRAWGAEMGKLHAASREFVPPASPRRPSWAQQDSTCCDAARLPASETAARREYARVMEWLATHSKTPSSWGLIHGDFERTNFVIGSEGFGIYDFDDACYHWYLADVAHALWAFRHAPPSDRERFLRWFVEGYFDHCTLEAEVREHLSWFVRLRSLSLFADALQGHARPVPDERWQKRLRTDFGTPFRW